MSDSRNASEATSERRLGFFDRFLSLWVIGCIAAGVLLGQLIPAVPEFLSRLEYAQVSIPVAILIWLMIYPMMLKIDFASIVRATKQPKGLTVTTVTNWLIKPFTMYAIAWFFLKVVFRPWIDPALGTEYLAGAVLLGAAPCTAMVFVWSHLSDGDPAYTLVQVSVNDLIILVAFTPIVALLLGISDISIPWNTLLLSVVLFVVVPLAAGWISRVAIVKRRGLEYFENEFIPKFNGVTTVGLLLTLIILFSFQGEIILGNPLHIVLIAIPLIIQTYLIYSLAYGWAWLWRVPHPIAGPGAMIGASNFFELAVAVAISLFGLSSGAALATVVGILVEVPVMLSLVRFTNKTRQKFSIRSVA
ncbi:MAG: ACR3 family arsenite efflux transporter [Spirochaetota bacterium]